MLYDISNENIKYRMRPIRHGHPWKEADDRFVYNAFVSGIDIADIAQAQGRTVRRTKVRLRRLGLIDKLGQRVIPAPPFERPARSREARPTREYPVRPDVRILWQHGDNDKFLLSNFHGEISARLYNCLKALDIHDIRKAFEIPDEILLRHPNFGRKSLRELHNRERALHLEIQESPRALAKPDVGQESFELTSETAEILRELLLSLIQGLHLKERDATIICARMGLSSEYKRVTLADLGKIFGITRERVRQIQNKAFRRLNAKIGGTAPAAWQFKKISCGFFSASSAEVIDAFSDKHFDYPLSLHIAVFLAMTSGLYKKQGEAQAAIETASSKRWQAQKRAARRLFREKRHLQKYSRIFEQALHPVALKTFQAPVAEFSGAKREINPDSIGRTGSFFSEKCQREVVYESREEYLAFQIIEHSPKVIWYQEQPLAIPYVFLGETRQYYPDLAVVTDESHCLVIEIKARNGLIEKPTLRKALAAIDYLHARGISYILSDSRGRTLKELAAAPVREEVVAKIERVLAATPLITYPDFKIFRQMVGLQSREFASLVINLDLAFETSPFRISRLPPDLSFRRFIGKNK